MCWINASWWVYHLNVWWLRVDLQISTESWPGNPVPTTLMSDGLGGIYRYSHWMIAWKHSTYHLNVWWLRVDLQTSTESWPGNPVPTTLMSDGSGWMYSYPFYLHLYGVRHMVNDHTDSEGGNVLPPHGLLFLISSKGSFICIIPHTTAYVTPVVEHWLE